MILNQMCPNGSYLIHALLLRNQLCRDYALFGGHFWPKYGGRGHRNILKDREARVHGNEIVVIRKEGNHPVNGGGGPACNDEDGGGGGDARECHGGVWWPVGAV